MKLFKNCRNLDVKLVLTIGATLSTLFWDMFALAGEFPGLWTVLFWTLPLSLSAFLLLLDFDMDYPTMSLRLALFGLLLTVYGVRLEFGMQDMQMNFAILFVWRGIDLVLMWHDWKKCNS
jgi:hypothetical protein